ncbi:MAG: DUF4118 domain-containing protein [Methylococcales bacterium]
MPRFLNPQSPQYKFNYLWGIIAPGLCTLIAWPLRYTLGSASILMTYNLGVFLVAANHGRGASILASLLSVPAFAFFFAPPIFSFAITDLDNIIGLLVMLVVANLTSNLLDKIRLQADIAQQKENQATALYRLNRDLSETLDDKMLAGTVVAHLYEEFKVSSVLLLPDADNQLCYPQDSALAQSLLAVDLKKAQQVYMNGAPAEPAGNFSTSVKNAVIYIALQGSQAHVGVVAVQPIKAELRAFLTTFLHQIALTLERLHLAAQAREALIQAEAEASRNSLLSAISHDLRTPLTRIVGTAGTLVDNNRLTDAERLEFNKVIQDEAQRMSDLMNKILDMARLAAGAIILHREWYTLEEIVGGALTRVEKMLGDRPIHINLPDDLPLVWIDGVLVQQVLINLLENASKYTPAHSAIDISAQESAVSLTLSIADRGPGIPAAAAEKIFEKFYRLESESAQNSIGLGLALCRTIMNSHGGSIQATNSRSGPGAVFTLSLPLHEPPQIYWDETVAAK